VFHPAGERDKIVEIRQLAGAGATANFPPGQDRTALSLTQMLDSKPLPYETTDPDVRLMLQVRDDNAAAFEELVLRYQGRLITVLQNLVQNRDRAEELAQDVFLRVYRARKTYLPDARFSTWLFTIAHNVGSNALRSRARRHEVNVTAAPGSDSSGKPLDDLATAPSSLMPARQLDKAELAEVVRAAVDSLNERQRMAILLAKFEHMSYADIAATMGLSVKAVKSLLSRARENLRVILEPYLQEGIRP
jgi:RNA polymerase sigma-70 factor, ECF subfamily